MPHAQYPQRLVVSSWGPLKHAVRSSLLCRMRGFCRLPCRGRRLPHGFREPSDRTLSTRKDLHKGAQPCSAQCVQEATQIRLEASLGPWEPESDVSFLARSR